MSSPPKFTARDRVVVIAPHPDDESIATGGLLQLAHDAGAACCVLIVTDGDNNPWPQRWVEKRWRIGAGERARWGARRRGEAMTALGVLGLNSSDARFFGLPDLGLSDMLMHGNASPIELLQAQFAEFQPTWVVLPALNDRHPDHSALHVLARLALAGYSGAAPKLLAFGVHGEGHDASHVELPLTEKQRAVKHAAIFAHASQMQLSRKRFLAYATTQEPFQSVAMPGMENLQHPLHAHLDDRGELNVHIDRRRWPASVAGYTLFVVLQYAEKAGTRWQVQFKRSGDGEVRDSVSGGQVAAAAIARLATEWVVTLALDARPVQGYVKIARAAPGLFVFDRIGWQTVALPRT